MQLVSPIQSSNNTHKNTRRCHFLPCHYSEFHDNSISRKQINLTSDTHFPLTVCMVLARISFSYLLKAVVLKVFKPEDIQDSHGVGLDPEASKGTCMYNGCILN